MRKKEWFLVILPLFFTWGLDRLTKISAERLQGFKSLGFFGLSLHHNHGAMLGLFSSLPAVLRVVSFSTGGAFLLFLFVVIQFLMPIKSLTLRTGLSILIGGILGNVTDRILTGYVVDFLIIGTQKQSTPAFNFADALQWVGYGMIAFALLREGEILWPESETRKVKWVNFKFQLRYCLILVAIGLGFSVISGVYSYTFMKVTISDLIGNNARLLDQYLLPFIFNFVIVSLAFSVILFLTGRILSQRMAGPIYAFEKYVDDLINDRPRVLRLRASDEFKQLEKLALRISNELIVKNNLPTASPYPKVQVVVGEESAETTAAEISLDTTFKVAK